MAPYSIRISLLFCFSVFFLGCGKEPVYKGKPMSHWVSQLKDSDPQFRREAAIALANIGPKAKSAVPALVEVLKDQDVQVRSQAAYTLACLGPAAIRARPALKQAMGDNSSDVRITAAGALIATGESDALAIQVVVGSLRDAQNASHGQTILDKLGAAGSTVVPSLIELLHDSDPMVRFRAIDALESLGPNAREAVGALTNAQNDSDVLVRVCAKRALEKIQK